MIEAKGAYAVENFVLARRLMFWQVYLHKTVLAADHLLRAAFARARARWAEGGARDPALAATSPALAVFLAGAATAADVEDDAVLDHFGRLDDTDVLYSLKRWAEAADPLLADLARRFLDRDLFRTHYLPAPLPPEDLAALRERVADWLVAGGLSTSQRAFEDAAYYVAVGVSRLDAYRLKGDTICILGRDGRLRELSEAEDVAAVGALAGVVEKPYVCVPKEVGGLRISDRGLRIDGAPDPLSPTPDPR